MTDSNDDSDDSYDENEYDVENEKENNTNDKAFNERMKRWRENEEALLLETNLYNVQRNQNIVNQISQHSQGDDDSFTKSNDDNQGSSSALVGTQSHVFTSNTQNIPDIGNTADNDFSQDDDDNDFDMSNFDISGNEINADAINDECENILNTTSGHMNKKITTAMKHFDRFLNKFYKNGKKHDEISYKDLTIGLIGCFIQFFM